MLYDEEIWPETAPDGQAGWRWRGEFLAKGRVHSQWQAPGDVRLMRIRVRTPSGPALAEVAVADGQPTRLRHLWQ